MGNIKSADDTDPQSWKLRALLWRSCSVYNGVIKLTAVKHIPTLTMFSYGNQIFPASLSSIAPVADWLKPILREISTDCRIFSDDSPWHFVELNLEMISISPAKMSGTDLNMLEMMHFFHACAVGCARQLTEEIGFNFVAKPLDSLL